MNMNVRVEGHPCEILRVSLECSCGKIVDGIGFEHARYKARDPRFSGGWVVSFKDVERIYKAALKARKPRRGGVFLYGETATTNTARRRR